MFGIQMVTVHPKIGLYHWNTELVFYSDTTEDTF